MMKKTVVFTGGGTAGHVYPGLSVAETLGGLDDEIRMIWIGSSGGMEKQIAGQAGIEYIGLPSGKLRRYFSIRNFIDLFKIAAGLLKAFFVLKGLKPDIVFSKGGFVSVPPVVAAGIMGIPVFSHESDLTPGLATRINSRFSEKIFVSYAQSLEYFAPGKAEVSGNPVRSEILSGNAGRGRGFVAKAVSESGGTAGTPETEKIILVLGGSQGALQINRLIEELCVRLCQRYTIVHQSGAHRYEGEMPASYVRREYIREELPDIMAAADLIVSRAGASTLWEAAVLGRPAILIPLGTGASRGDQMKNAGIFRDSGAARVLSGEVTAGMLEKEITYLLENDDILKEMSAAARDIAKPVAARIISEKIIERLK